jgi:alpha-L-rhamnosidase
MGKIRFLPALVVLLLTLPAMAQAADTPVDHLRCEYLNNPLGLDVVKPRLSWRMTADRRGAKQTAFHVLVASSSDALEKGQGDLWDSGIVPSEQSNLVEYAGKPLASGQACFWKVLVIDETGKSGGWSAPAMWTVGLLSPADWTGKWIGQAPEPDDAKSKTPPPAPLLRKSFAIDKPLKRATAYVCSLGLYELSIDGKKVGDHFLDPPITQFNKRALYVTYDVTPLLASGKNAIGLELGSGWYDTTVPDAWNFQRAPWRARPQAIVQLNIEYADGTTASVVSDGSWKQSTGALVFDQGRIGEQYDARLEKTGWSTADYDDSAWTPAAIREGATGAVSASNVEPIRVVDTIQPKTVTEVKPGVFVFDLGKNVAAVPKLTVTGPAGTVIKMVCAERLHADGTIDNANIAQDNQSADFQTDIYTCRGTGVETYEPKFTFHGFQYVQVEGYPGKPVLNAVVADIVRTSFAPAGHFECSNELVNKIEDAAIRAYASNFVGIPSDCPHREKNGWTGDAQLAVAMGLEHFHGEAAYTQWIQTLEDCQRADGKLPCIAPSTSWGYNRLDGPAWESAYFLVPWEVYQQTGDDRILKSHYEGYKKWLDWYAKKAKGDLIEYGLGDWAPVKTQTPGMVTSSGYYHQDLLITADVADMLGKPDEARTFRDTADRVRAAFNAKFFDPATRQYAGGTQTGLSCALYQGLAADTDRAAVADNLVAAVHKSGDHIDTGILGAKYLLRELSDTGHADVAWTIATQRTAPSWGKWIDDGATTLWEEWDGSSSRNHIMFGDISAWFVEYLAGIKVDPTGPGYKKIFIRPMPVGNLTSVTADHDTPYGLVKVAWTKSADGVLTLKLDVPPNTTATVWMPGDGVTESGKPGARDSKFSVGSGHHEFSSHLK